jgi:uncharacterized protein YggE
MRIGGVMKGSTLAVVAGVMLAVLVAGCGGSNDGTEGTMGAGEGGVAVGDAVKGMGSPIAYQGTGAGGGVLPGITVTGSGSAKAVPDVSDWSFGVQTDGSTASAALGSASQATKRILAALRDAGVAKEDLRTEQVSLYPNMSEDGRSVTGYSASSSVYATVRHLGKAGAVVDAAVAAGGNQVSGPSLRVSDNQAQYRAAVSDAMDDARARAQALAAKAGLTLGAPIAIVDTGGGYPVPIYGRALAAADEAMPIEPGVDEITATLTVTFAIS